jgi:Lrp/AsnC family transcriptional regulator for asnA, asnC and gidA
LNNENRTLCAMTRKRTGTAAGVGLDEVSKAIIEQLQQDGRRSYAAIGKEVGLSEAAVRQRVQRLIDSGVIQVVAVTDPLQLGFARQAMIGITVDGPIEPVAEAIAAIEEVDYVVFTAGTYDLLAEIVAESDEHLLSLISGAIRTIPGVSRTETFMYLKLQKQTYNFGVPA